MKAISKDVLANLSKLERKLDTDALFEHQKNPGMNDATEVFTLAHGVTRPLSPMLAARFAYAGEWRGAALGRTLVSLETMRDWEDDEELRELVELSREDYPQACLRMPN